MLQSEIPLWRYIYPSSLILARLKAVHPGGWHPTLLLRRRHIAVYVRRGHLHRQAPKPPAPGRSWIRIPHALRRHHESRRWVLHLLMLMLMLMLLLDVHLLLCLVRLPTHVQRLVPLLVSLLMRVLAVLLRPLWWLLLIRMLSALLGGLYLLRYLGTQDNPRAAQVSFTYMPL